MKDIRNSSLISIGTGCSCWIAIVTSALGYATKHSNSILVHSFLEKWVPNCVLFDNINLSLEKLFELGFQAEKSLKEIFISRKGHQNINVTLRGKIFAGGRPNKIQIL